MCGIAGLVGAGHGGESVIRAMTDALRHRGPDDEGVWRDEAADVLLGQRRLSIVDLSPAGHQPMLSASGRYAITYNGEIYNFNELRQQLEAETGGQRWRGHSDTEVLLAAVERWGFRAALEQAVGMFALALWDRERRELWLARDRLGEKPLYYGRLGRLFVFASELKAIRAGVPQVPEVDRAALADFMQYGYIPAPRTIYRGLQKLPPGTCVRVVGGLAQDPERYWSLDTAGHDHLRAELARADDDTRVAMLQERLTRAVAQQMVADVPLGAFLSGGIDSSLIVGLMQSQSRVPVRTFTIGFAEAGFDEAPFARAVAQHLGTDHTELYVTPRDALDTIPSMPRIYDEPFADSSQIPTTLVSRLTRRSVTVSLSGDGGDELFAGYPRYANVARLWPRVQRLPLLVRRAAAATLSTLSPRQWDRVLVAVPGARQRGVTGHRLGRLAQMVTTQSFGELYERAVSQWQPEDRVVRGLDASQPFQSRWVPSAHGQLEGMRRWDAQWYLPDDILVKVDRAAMSVSLESRAPLLDHRVVELAFALPEHALVRDGQTKWLLRRLLDRFVPRALIDRPKSGFALPLAEWLRTPLRAWAEDLLDARALDTSGFLDTAQVRSMWGTHVSGRADRSPHLWSVLMFQAWLREQRPVVAGSAPRSQPEIALPA